MVIETKCRAFGRRIEVIRAIVGDEGTIRVWDSLAGYFTTCHSLSPAACRRIRKLARAQRGAICPV